MGALGLSLTAAGCSGGDDIAALDRAATSQDQLPDYVLTQNIDVDSVRQVVERDGVTYFISKRENDRGFCVIRTKGQDETAWGAGCGGGTGRIITNFTIGIPEQVTLVTDGYATENLEEEGWTKVTDNLLIQ